MSQLSAQAVEFIPTSATTKQEINILTTQNAQLHRAYCTAMTEIEELRRQLLEAQERVQNYQEETERLSRVAQRLAYDTRR